MKLLATLLALVFSAIASATSLQWDANPPADAVTGYNVYEKTSVAGVAKYTKVNTALVVVTTFQLSPTLAPGAHVFVCTAVNAGGESGYSNEVTVTPLPAAPKALRVLVEIAPQAPPK